MNSYTTTIQRYINSELQNAGFNELYNNNRITGLSDEFAFMNKIVNYDDDVKKIVDKRIFRDYKFKNEDKNSFKKLFVNRFMNRQIGRQTIDLFSSNLLGYILTYENYINIVFSDDVYDYLNNVSYTNTDNVSNGNNNQISNSNSQTISDSISHNKGRNADADLPQEQVNLNLDDNTAKFASKTFVNNDSSDNHTESNTNTNNTSDTKTENITNVQSITRAYNLNSLNDLKNLRDRIFKEIDRKFFLQIW